MGIEYDADKLKQEINKCLNSPTINENNIIIKTINDPTFTKLLNSNKFDELFEFFTASTNRTARVLASILLLSSVDFLPYITILYNGMFSLPVSSISVPKNVKKIEEYAFEYNPPIKHIFYEGTLSEWDSIEKEKNWDYNVVADIQCKDGIWKIWEHKQ